MASADEGYDGSGNQPDAAPLAFSQKFGGELGNAFTAAAKKAGLDPDDPVFQQAFAQWNNQVGGMQTGTNPWDVYNGVLNATGNPQLAGQAISPTDPRYRQGAATGVDRDAQLKATNDKFDSEWNSDLKKGIALFAAAPTLGLATGAFGAGSGALTSAGEMAEVGTAFTPAQLAGSAGAGAGGWAAATDSADASLGQAMTAEWSPDMLNNILADASTYDAPIQDINPGDAGYQPTEIAQSGANAPLNAEAASDAAAPSTTKTLAEQTVNGATKEPGIIDRAMNSDIGKWAKENPRLASGVLQAGGSMLGGMAKGALDVAATNRASEAALKNKETLTKFNRDFIQSGSQGGRGVTVNAKSTGAKPLLDMNGNPVYGPKGIINRALQR